MPAVLRIPRLKTAYVLQVVLYKQTWCDLAAFAYMPGSFSILYLRDVSALVASLQQTGNEIPKEIQVLFWQGFLQLLDTTEDTVN